MTQEHLIEILGMLPRIVKKDSYFEELKDIVLKDLGSGVFLLSKIGISDNIYASVSMDIQNQAFSLTDGVLFYILYGVNGMVVEFGVKKEEDKYLVHLEKIENGISTKTILVKKGGSSIIETVVSERNNGYFARYDVDVYCYDREYTKDLEVDKEILKDELFSQEFGIPLVYSRSLRNNFLRYSKAISTIRTVLKIRERDNNLSEEEKCLFRPPFIVRDFRTFIYQENERLGVNLGKKYQSLDGVDSLPCIDRLDNIIDSFAFQLGEDSEIVISDNLFQNLVLVASGYFTESLDTSGTVIRKNGNGFDLYYVGITKEGVTMFSKVISQEMAILMFQKNPLNEIMPNLGEFFGGSRGRN